MSLRAVAALSTLIGLLLSSSSVRADLPPPNGQKFVPFYATVTGLDADHVLLVYPWSLSNGAPTEEIGVLAEGSKLAFGRRIMGEPKIYAMKKAEWEAKKAEITSLPVEGALDCGTTISPRHLVDRDAPDEILASYRVAELSDSACRLAIGDAEPSEPAPSDTPSDPPASAPTDAPSDVAAPVTPAANETPSAGGCAACCIIPAGASSAPWWLLGLGILAWRRRDRKA